MATLPSNNQRKTGTGFTNLQRILDANKNNKLASTIGTGVTNTANQVRQNLQTDVDTFNKDAEAQKLNTIENQNRYKGLLANPTQNAPGTPLAPPRMETFGTDVNQQSIDDFSRFRAGLYSGPTDLKNAAQLKVQAEEAQALGKNIANQGNKFGLLQQYFGTPTYTRGQQGLDSLLMGGAPELQQARRQTVGLNKLADNKIGQSRDLAKNITAENQAFGKQVNTDLGLGDDGQITGGALGSIYNPLADKVAAAKPTNQAYLDELVKYKTANLFGNEVAMIDGKNMGLTYGAANPGSFLSEHSLAANVNNVASKEDFARMNALAKLAGIDNTYLTDESQAGTWDNHKATSYNKAGYDADVQSRKTSYENEKASIDKQVEAIANKRYQGTVDPAAIQRDRDKLMAPLQEAYKALRKNYSLSQEGLKLPPLVTRPNDNPGSPGIQAPGVETLLFPTPGAWLSWL